MVGDVFRKAVEKRRKSLIEKLIAFQEYKIDDKHVFELTLTELEHEYKRLLLQSHPHDNVRSIHWTNRNS